MRLFGDNTAGLSSLFFISGFRDARFTFSFCLLGPKHKIVPTDGKIFNLPDAKIQTKQKKSTSRIDTLWPLRLLGNWKLSNIVALEHAPTKRDCFPRLLRKAYTLFRIFLNKRYKMWRRSKRNAQIPQTVPGRGYTTFKAYLISKNGLSKWTGWIHYKMPVLLKLRIP